MHILTKSAEVTACERGIWIYIASGNFRPVSVLYVSITLRRQVEMCVHALANGTSEEVRP